MKVLVIGSGGREHALAHTFNRQGHSVFCVPGNGGTEKITESLPEKWVALNIENFEELVEFVKDQKIDLTVCGPEAPLERGVADVFKKHQQPFFGPSQQATQLEAEKAFSKEFMNRNQIPTARSVTCRSAEEAREAAKKYFHEWEGIVVKPSGLTAGKGVTVCNTLKEAMEAINAIMEQKKYGEAGSLAVIEEKLLGKEVSVMAFCDGKTIIPMITAQDHKRLYDGGQGPNTGGVGAYTPTPFLGEQMMQLIEERVIDQTLNGLQEEGISYIGFLYFGIMLTADGPKLLEYNCRFGDPEAQVILPLLKTDLATLCLACCGNKLDQVEVEWNQAAACTVVCVSRGYPLSYKTGFPIKGLDGIKEQDDLILFHAGTKISQEGNIVTSGGRVLAITAIAPTLQEAIERSYQVVKTIEFQGIYYRSDIGSKSGIEEGTANLTATI